MFEFVAVGLCHGLAFDPDISLLPQPAGSFFLLLVSRNLSAKTFTVLEPDAVCTFYANSAVNITE